MSAVLERSHPNQPQNLNTRRRFRLNVTDLTTGMFVVELDRPWLDTPFLLQGFIIDSQIELDTMRRICTYAYVDLDASLPEVQALIKTKEVVDPADSAPPRQGMPRQVGPVQEVKQRRPERNRGASVVKPATEVRSGPPSRPNRSYQARSDVRISQETRRRFRDMVRASQGVDPASANPSGLIAWLLRKLGLAHRIRPIPVARTLPPDCFPANVKPVVHRQTKALAEELPRAIRTFEQGARVMKSVLGDLRNGKVLDMENVSGCVDSMVESMVDNPDALMWAARLREVDSSTYEHSLRVALYLIALGRHMGFPKRELGYLGQIGLLADVGKIKLPRALLEKPGMLNPGEFSLIKEHVRIGLTILSTGQQLPESVLTGIAQHHERVDGSGYPRGLKASEISVYGRMAAIADSFSALITPRNYASATAPQDALMNLFEWSGTSFHPPLVEQFVQAIGVFPVGSMIELSTGEVAVVIAHNRTRRLEPRVLVLSGPDKVALPQPEDRDLFRETSDDDGTPRVRIARGLPAGSFGFSLDEMYLTEAIQKDGILS